MRMASAHKEIKSLEENHTWEEVGENKDLTWNLGLSPQAYSEGDYQQA
jgi:hypothetical protein